MLDYTTFEYNHLGPLSAKECNMKKKCMMHLNLRCKEHNCDCNMGQYNVANT